MLERVIENWLDNAIETTFQKPFCFMLSHQGYTVTHLTRHCGMELGKDVLAVSPDGIPHCYQLKGGQGKRISLNDWNTSLHNQMRSLVEMPIVHHSIALGQNKK